MRKYNLFLKIGFPFFFICLSNCNLKLNNVEGWFKQTLSLNQIFNSSDCEKKWNQLSHSFDNIKSEDFLMFEKTVILYDSSQINNDLIINPREDFLKFVRETMDTNKTYLGAVVKERLTNGSKMSYKVSLYLIEKMDVLIFHYVQSPNGFILEKSHIMDYKKFVKSLNYSLFPYTKSDKRENRNLLYCITIFTNTPLYSRMIFDDNYFDDAIK